MQTPAQPAVNDASPVKDDGTANAISALSAQVQALAAQDRSITIHTPPVTFNAGDTHITPAAVTVEGHEISVNLPEGCIQLEATVQAPAVTVQSAPAQVVVQQQPRTPTRQLHKRDADGNLIETITTFES